jgi:hypothetical protein
VSPEPLRSAVVVATSANREQVVTEHRARGLRTLCGRELSGTRVSVPEVKPADVRKCRRCFGAAS